MCRLLPCPRGLPRYSGGSASASSLSRPAQASLTLWPAGLLSRPWRPLSRGFDPTSYPVKPLVSYQTYRQLSGWILPPLVKRAIGAHRIIRVERCLINKTNARQQVSHERLPLCDPYMARLPNFRPLLLYRLQVFFYTSGRDCAAYARPTRDGLSFDAHQQFPAPDHPA